MILQGLDNNKYYLSLDLLKDIDLTDLCCKVDGEIVKVPLSNQGHYAIYLDQFKTCVIDESSLYTAFLKMKNDRYDEAIASIASSLLETKEKIVPQNELYLNLPKENTERIYHIFKRLLNLTKEAILNKDDTLKHWIIRELKKQIELEYHGRNNYQGNWWVYEIGIPRCLNEMLILLYKDINKTEICELMNIENFYIPNALYEYYRRNYPDIKRIFANYANLADTIYICLLKSLLLNDEIGV